MLIVQYLVKVTDDKLIPNDEVEDARFFNIPELPSYYTNLFQTTIAEIQEELPLQ